jgi:diketogulonate reductase-like aldo/keto reductase
MQLLYGTAWKEDETERLVSLALQCGFRGIDTANQRKHYHEAQVGSALKAAFARGMKREELFLQTKFTFRGGQDDRLPYDPKASISKQVEQSFESSLEHLGVTSLDSYVLHGPSRRSGWSAEDEEAWAAMESLHASGKTKALGVSNVSIEQLELLCARAKLRPQYVQNRCYASTGWDREVREFCLKHQLRYQGFSLLTANPRVLRSEVVTRAAKRLKRTAAQVIFRFACDVGMLPLTGTTDEQHMREDLALDFSLTEEQVREIARTGS